MTEQQPKIGNIIYCNNQYYPGKNIGEYVLLKMFGRNEFTTTYLCIHVPTEKQYVVKIIHEKKNFKYNMEIIAKLKNIKHDFIVSLHDMLISQNHVYIFYEYVPNANNLYEKIVDNERLDENLSRKIFQQIIIAMNFYHQHNLYYSDYKFDGDLIEDVLIDENENIKIINWGFYNLCEKNIGTWCVIKPPRYILPEHIKGEINYNKFKADIWICGIALFTMLSGQYPFDDKSFKTMFRNIENCEYKMSEYISEGARNLIRRILVADPASRYSIENIFADSWFNNNLVQFEIDQGIKVYKP